jgi:hypothetical protein
MARRIGFGDTPERAERSSPSTPGDPPGNDGTPGSSSPLARLRFGPRSFEQIYAGEARPAVWFIIAFLGFWLAGWTVGILFAVGALVGTLGSFGFETVFLVVWVIAALAGWAFAVWVLLRLVQGMRSVSKRPEPGEQVPD